MTKELITIRPCDFKRYIWYEVMLVNPLECYNQYVKGKGMYVGFKAIFPFMKTKRPFNLLLPLKRFERELLAIRPILRQGDPVMFEIRFEAFGRLSLRNWQVLK